MTNKKMLLYFNKLAFSLCLVISFVLVTFYPHYSTYSIDIDPTKLIDKVSSKTNVTIFSSLFELCTAIGKAAAWPFTKALSLYNYLGVTMTVTIAGLLTTAICADPANFPKLVRFGECAIQFIVSGATRMVNHRDSGFGTTMLNMMRRTT